MNRHAPPVITSCLMVILLAACAVPPAPTTVPTIAQPTITQAATTIPPTATTLPTAAAPAVTATSESADLSRPGRLRYHTLYDPVLKSVLLIANDYAATDVWAYDVAGQKLTRLADRPVGYVDSVVYDSHNGGLIANAGNTGKTWFSDPAQDVWKELPQSKAYGESALTPAGYDSESGKVVIATGYTEAPDTITFDSASATWKDMKPSTSAPWIQGGTMAYDAESDRMILWDGAVIKRVWAYDTNTNTWEEILYTGGPNRGGGYGASVYIPELDRIFVYFLDQFFAYDTNTNLWEQAKGDLKPGPRLNHSMAYDPEARRIVIYGGSDENNTVLYNDLWQYDPVTGEWAELLMP